jgi:hypothetical protein
MVDLGRELGDYGEVLGQMPQVEQTNSYFQTAYPQMNAYQLAIGESTLSQREELKLDRSICKQIMTIEQAQAFAFYLMPFFLNVRHGTLLDNYI